MPEDIRPSEQVGSESTSQFCKVIMLTFGIPNVITYTLSHSPLPCLLIILLRVLSSVEVLSTDDEESSDEDNEELGKDLESECL